MTSAGRAARSYYDPLTDATVLAGGLYQSTDGGTSFSRIDGKTGSGLPLTDSVFDVIGDPTNPAEFYTATPRGVYHSTTGGARPGPPSTARAATASPA